MAAAARPELLKLFIGEVVVDRSEATTKMLVDGKVKSVHVIAESDRLHNLTFNDPILDGLLARVFRQQPHGRDARD